MVKTHVLFIPQWATTDSKGFLRPTQDPAMTVSTRFHELASEDERFEWTTVVPVGAVTGDPRWSEFLKYGAASQNASLALLEFEPGIGSHALRADFSFLRHRAILESFFASAAPSTNKPVIIMFEPAKVLNIISAINSLGISRDKYKIIVCCYFWFEPDSDYDVSWWSRQLEGHKLADMCVFHCSEAMWRMMSFLSEEDESEFVAQKMSVWEFAVNYKEIAGHVPKMVAKPPAIIFPNRISIDLYNNWHLFTRAMVLPYYITEHAPPPKLKVLYLNPSRKGFEVLSNYITKHTNGKEKLRPASSLEQIDEFLSNNYCGFMAVEDNAEFTRVDYIHLLKSWRNIYAALFTGEVHGGHTSREVMATGNLVVTLRCGAMYSVVGPEYPYLVDTMPSEAGFIEDLAATFLKARMDLSRRGLSLLTVNALRDQVIHRCSVEASWPRYSNEIIELAATRFTIV